MPSRLSAVERKVAAVLGVAVSEPMDDSAVADVLAQDLVQYVVGAIADPDRGIDRIEHEPDKGEHFFLGYAGPTLRLLVGVVVDTGDKTAEITLRATKADRDALDDTDWGDAGPNVGNSTLVARVFHVGLVALRRCGIEAIVNTPFDARVRTGMRPFADQVARAPPTSPAGPTTSVLADFAEAARTRTNASRLRPHRIDCSANGRATNAARRFIVADVPAEAAAA